MNNIVKISLWAAPAVVLTLAAAFRRMARDHQKGQSFRKYSQLAPWVAVTIIITLAATTPAMACSGNPDDC